MKEKISVVIVDDIESHRRRLNSYFAEEENIEVVGEADNGYAAVMAAQMYKPDVMLIDIEMENKWAGINASKQINKVLPDIKIIILTVHEDDKTIYAAFQTGIVDYLIKSESRTDIVQAVHSAYLNRSPIRPMIADRIRKEFRKTKQAEENLLSVLRLIADFTPSELEILMHLCHGTTRNEITKIRMVEMGTIKKQINGILKKCHHKNIKELVAEMKNTGIFDVLQKMYNE